MAEPVFDTQKAVRQLRDEAGFEEKAAEAMVRVIADAMQSVATKRDLDDLRRDVDAKMERLEERFDTKIDGVEWRLDAKIDGVEGRLDAKIDGVEERLNARIDRLEEKFDERIDRLEERLNARMDRLEERVTGLIAQGHKEILKIMLFTMAGAMTALTAIFSFISKVL